MRVLGFILLLAGFIWLLLCAAYVGPLARAVLTQQYDRLPQQDSFTREQTLTEMRDVGLAMLHGYPGIVLPAFVSLCGGILLDRARRVAKHGNRDAS